MSKINFSNHQSTQDCVVLKFGGTSVSTLQNWQNIQEIIKGHLKQKRKVFIVHSALSQISNLLTQVAEEALTDQHHAGVTKFKQQHQNLIADMGLDEIC